jgi:uncharacterized protein (TIGR02646 family)
MIRVIRPALVPKERRGLTKYQQRVDQVLLAGADPAAVRAVVDRQWGNFGRTKLRDSLTGHLNQMSHYYCVYCGYNHGEEIDHFEPLSRSPGLAFVWSNYNWSCGICNGAKLAEFELDPLGHPLLLNPTGADETGRYFALSRLSGRLSPNRRLSPHDQKRAQYTIDTLNLNRDALAEERRGYAARLYHDLEHYCTEPTAHGAATLDRYLEEAQHLRLVVYLMVRSQDPEVLPLVDQWLCRRPTVGQTLYDRNWLPIL